MFGLWTMPFLISLSVGFWRMIVVWSFWTLTTAYIIKQARAQPLQPRTPRFVYGWFYRSYQVCSNTAILGYVLLMADWLLIPVDSPTNHFLGQYGLLMAFYGFYFGVLGRDCSEMCADWMASMIGFTGKKDEIPSRHIHPNLCGICGGKLTKQEVLTESEVDEDETKDKTVSLTCEHLFHSWCIRGWTIVGKKDVCPICCEKVNLSSTFVNPWEKQSIWWGNILDVVRYFIVWNPIILYVANLFLRFAHTKET
uniref:RING-type domain-containing protein n=1 Tax=Arcella intermedia TaxID=1963864 RepID=A0A6B2LCV8_9EUKA